MAYCGRWLTVGDGLLWEMAHCGRWLTVGDGSLWEARLAANFRHSANREQSHRTVVMFCKTDTIAPHIFLVAVRNLSNRTAHPCAPCDIPFILNIIAAGRASHRSCASHSCTCQDCASHRWPVTNLLDIVHPALQLLY